VPTVQVTVDVAVTAAPRRVSTGLFLLRLGHYREAEAFLTAAAELTDPA
jgi:hypothetical protein